jgi:choline dehydrogenase-like flavoprotein
VTRRDAPRAPSDRADVCIVGAGVAGSLVADRLATRGYEVVVLEAGRRFDPARRTERMARHLRPEHTELDVWEMGGPRDAYTTSGGQAYPLNRRRVKGVGGATLHWLGITPRLHEADFELASRHGLGADWPISYADLQPSYAAAEQELGVAGSDDNPFGPPRDTPYPMGPFPPSYADSLFAAACERLGIATHSVPQARNTTAYDGRSPCVGYSTCTPVCPSGAKYSGDVHARKAERAGARIIDRAPVQRLEHGSEGTTVDAAVYTTPDGRTHEQTARQFVVACGGVETARLLLLSRSEQYPDGLANSSGLVGRYFTEHPYVTTVAVLDEPTNQEPIGFPTSGSQQFYGYDGSTASIRLEFANLGPDVPIAEALSGGDDGPRSAALDPLRGDAWGDELFDGLRDSQPVNRRIGVAALVEQLPRAENRITLGSETDDRGNPVPDVHWTVDSRDRDALQAALDVQRRIVEELGGTVEYTTDSADPGVSGHHMCTTRMGTDPTDSVVDPRLRTHDVDNLSIVSSSVFVTAGAVNPTLTIAALALRAADHLEADL